MYCNLFDSCSLYGSKTLGQLGTLTDEYFEEEDQMMNDHEFSNGNSGGGSSTTVGEFLSILKEQEQAARFSFPDGRDRFFKSESALTISWVH
jgi:hypothetical protein